MKLRFRRVRLRAEVEHDHRDERGTGGVAEIAQRRDLARVGTLVRTSARRRPRASNTGLTRQSYAGATSESGLVSR